MDFWYFLGFFGWNFWGVWGNRGAEGRSRNRAAKLGTAPRSPYLYPLAKFGRSASKNGKSRKCFVTTFQKCRQKCPFWPFCGRQTCQRGLDQTADPARAGPRAAAAKLPNDRAKSRSTDRARSQKIVQNRKNDRKWPIWRSKNDLLQPHVGSAES